MPVYMPTPSASECLFHSVLICLERYLSKLYFKKLIQLKEEKKWHFNSISLVSREVEHTCQGHLFFFFFQEPFFLGAYDVLEAFLFSPTQKKLGANLSYRPAMDWEGNLLMREQRAWTCEGWGAGGGGEQRRLVLKPGGPCGGSCTGCHVLSLVCKRPLFCLCF